MIGLIAALLAVVTTPYAPVSYACDGSTANFTVNFPYLSSSDLTVTSTTAGNVVTTLSLTTDFTTNVVSTTSTAVLTILVPATKCPVGSTLKIARNTALTQPTGFRAQTVFNPTLHETALDRTEMQHQELSFKEITDLANVNNTVAAFNSSGAAIGSTTSVLATGDTTPRTLAAWLADFVNVKGKGAKGDGVTDDALALQAASDAAAARNNGKIYLPCGTYIINSSISTSPTYFGATLEGEATNCVTIKAGAAMTTMWSFTDVSQNGRFTFKNIAFDGNALAQFGIKSTKLAYSKFGRVDIRGTTVAAVQIQDGWDNTIQDCEFHDNTGDGLVTAGNANDFTILNTLFSNNSGWGVKTNGGGPFVIRGGAFQVNAKGAIYSVTGARPLTVDGVYFEQNGQTGFAFASPVKTVKADILLNGSGVETTMSHSFPTPSATIRGCLTSANFTEAFVYAIGILTMSVSNNFESSTAVPLVKTYGDNAFALPSYVTAEGNSGFLKDFDVETVTSSRSLSFSTFASNTVQHRNYLANKSVYAIPKITGGAGSTMVRGATKYNGRETFDVSGPSGDIFGVTIDTTVTTELANSLVYISAWAKSSSVSAGPRVAIGAKVNTSSFAADLLWHHIEFADFMPAASTVAIGFGRLGVTSTDVITFADVVVAVVGAPDRVFHRDLLAPTWSTTSTPTTGTWAQGDVVWNSAPVAAGVPGWICTAGGTPGTWKTMAAIAP